MFLFSLRTRTLLVAFSLACLEINFIISWCGYATFSFGIQNECYMSKCKYSQLKICKERQAAHLSFTPFENLLHIDTARNKLSVNTKKTNYVTFSPSQRKLNHSFSLSFGGQPLIQNNVTKFLGVYLDEHLTWKYHINFVCKQIAKSIGILSRTRFYLSCKTKLTLYYTLIYPYITYCNSTWSCT